MVTCMYVFYWCTYMQPCIFFLSSLQIVEPVPWWALFKQKCFEVFLLLRILVVSNIQNMLNGVPGTSGRY